MCGPLFSITHSARSPIAASVISARDGTPGLRQRLEDLRRPDHRHVRRLARARGSPPAPRPGARSRTPPPGRRARSSRRPPGWPSRRSRISGRCSKPARVSILSTTRGRGAPRPRRRSCSGSTSSARCTNDRPTRSACRATNARSSRSLSVSAGRSSRVSGRLMPLSARERLAAVARVGDLDLEPRRALRAHDAADAAVVEPDALAAAHLREHLGQRARHARAGSPAAAAPLGGAGPMPERVTWSRSPRCRRRLPGVLREPAPARSAWPACPCAGGAVASRAVRYTRRGGSRASAASAVMRATRNARSARARP